jgi:hypothetical protein
LFRSLCLSLPGISQRDRVEERRSRGFESERVSPLA